MLADQFRAELGVMSGGGALVHHSAAGQQLTMEPLVSQNFINDPTSFSNPICQKEVSKALRAKWAFYECT